MKRAAVAYVVRNGLLLSVVRADTGEHSAPGGKVEPGELFYEACRRELEEETGLIATFVRRIYRGPHRNDAGDWDVCGFLVEAEGEPIAREPGTQVAWVCAEEIANGFGAKFHRKALEAEGLLIHR